MSGRCIARRIAYLCWALMLVAGLSFNSAQAEALHSTCGATCTAQCGDGNCKRFMDLGCSCFYRCSDGSGGTAVCVI